MVASYFDKREEVRTRTASLKGGVEIFRIVVL
jgi:hypothetical protein